MKPIDQKKIEKIKRLAEEYLLENSPDTDPDYWIAYDIVELCDGKFSFDWEEEYKELEAHYFDIENKLEDAEDRLRECACEEMEYKINDMQVEIDDLEAALYAAQSEVERLKKELDKYANQTTS